MAAKDSEFIATVVECPSLTWMADTREQALEAAKRNESMNTYVIKQLGLIDA